MIVTWCGNVRRKEAREKILGAISCVVSCGTVEGFRKVGKLKIEGVMKNYQRD